MPIDHCIRPLTLITIGALVCFIDLEISWTTMNASGGATGWRFDLVPDVVGTACIASGLVTLRRFRVSTAWTKTMSFIVFVALLNFAAAILDHRVRAESPSGALVWSFGALTTVAILAYFGSMATFCAAHRLHPARRAWRLALTIHIVSLILYFAVARTLPAFASPSEALMLGRTLFWMCGLLTFGLAVRAASMTATEARARMRDRPVEGLRALPLRP